MSDTTIAGAADNNSELPDYRIIAARIAAGLVSGPRRASTTKSFTDEDADLGGKAAARPHPYYHETHGLKVLEFVDKWNAVKRVRVGIPAVIHKCSVNTLLLRFQLGSRWLLEHPETCNQEQLEALSGMRIVKRVEGVEIEYTAGSKFVSSLGDGFVVLDNNTTDQVKDDFFQWITDAPNHIELKSQFVRKGLMLNDLDIAFFMAQVEDLNRRNPDGRDYVADITPAQVIVIKHFRAHPARERIL